MTSRVLVGLVILVGFLAFTQIANADIGHGTVPLEQSQEQQAPADSQADHKGESGSHDAAKESLKAESQANDKEETGSTTGKLEKIKKSAGQKAQAENKPAQSRSPGGGHEMGQMSGYHIHNSSHSGYFIVLAVTIGILGLFTVSLKRL